MSRNLCRGPSCRSLVVACLAVLVGSVVVAQRAAARDLPPDAAQLLPAGATAVVVLSSLDEAEQAWRRLSALAGPPGSGDEATNDNEEGEAQEQQRPPKSPRDLIATLAPDLAPYADATRPVAMAFVIGAPMFGQPYSLTLALPLQERARDPYFVSRLAGDANVVVRGGYAGVSSDSTYAPGATTSLLIADLPDGTIVARADLKAAIAMVRPIVEMGLLALSQQGAAAPPDSAAPRPPAMSAEQIVAIQTFARGVLDAAQRLDIALDLAPGHDRLHGTFAVAPGSIFDVGPQPDFARALELSGLLSRDLDFVQASALDVSRPMDALAPFYAAMMKEQQEELPSGMDESYARWITDGFLVGRAWMHPYAGGASFGPEGMRMEVLAAQPEPEKALAATLAYYQGIGALGAGLALAEGEAEDVDGVHVRSFALTVDEEQFAKLAPSPSDSATGPDPLAIMRAMAGLYPPFRVATLPGLVVACGDRDPAAMRALLARAKEGGGSVPPGLAAAAAAAGAGTQAIVQGDLGRLLSGVADLVADMTGSPPPEGGLPEAGAVPFTATNGVRGLELDFALECDLDALATIGETLDAMFGGAQPDSTEAATGED